MQRILVIGSSGSGKTTLAREMGSILGLPVIHLDAHFWNSGWVQTPRPEWREKQQELIGGESWIIDGDFLRDLDLRLSRADTVVLLEFGRLACLLGVVRRWLTHYGRQRPDMAPGCPEKLDLEFLLWVWRFPRRRKPTRRILEEHGSHCWIVVLKSRADTKRFLNEIRAVASPMRPSA